MSQRWTTSDFDSLSWHDCHVHGFRFGIQNLEYGACELEFDIDFITEWILQSDRTFRFRIAPATLTFHNVFGLRFSLDYATPTMGMMPFSIDGIERETILHGPDHISYRWRLPINLPDGEITFESPGFTQVLTREPIIHEMQCLPPSERKL